MTRSSLKIALVVPHIQEGGIETFVLRLASFLNKEGHRTTIIACEQEGSWWQKVREYGIEGICLQKQDTSFTIPHILKLGNLLKDYDCLLLNHARFAHLALNMLSDRTAIIPIIHGDILYSYRTAFVNHKAWNVAVGVSPKVARKAQDMLPSKKTVAILHGTHLPTESELLNRAPFHEEIRGLFVGRLAHSDKGLLYLPRIAEECLKRKIRLSLDIIGDGKDRKQLLREISERELSGHVTLLGSQNNARVYHEMLNHHFLLMPSHYEGFGIVAIEALSTGCVPVASRLPGVTDAIIDDGRTGFLCDVGKISDFVDAIEKLCGNRELWDSMSRAGAAQAQAQFSIEKMGKQYLDLIYDVLDGKHPLTATRRRRLKVDPSLLRCSDLQPYWMRQPRKFLMKKLHKPT